MPEELTLVNCPDCLRPLITEGTEPTTQWTSFCKCHRPYKPNHQFTIDLCMNCHQRIMANATRKVEGLFVCACATPNPKTIPNFQKQNNQDDVFDLTPLGWSADTFPMERYTPLGILGQRTRADVILARDNQSGKKVAVKCFKQIKPDTFTVFEQDARKNKQLTHTNIARLIDLGIHQNKTPYLVTEYKDGFNLEQYIALIGTPSHDVAVMIMMSVCEVLLYAQKESLLHRDIRPGNIIFLDDMNANPSVSITDFSMPKVKAKEELSDPKDAYYLSSDESRNMEYDERSEVYSIGCVGFALLAGRPPFIEGTARDIRNSHSLKLPPRISNLKFEAERPKDLEEVVERCLEKDPKVRFDSVAKFNERLEVFPRREQMQIAAVRAAKKRKKLLRIAIIAIIVMLLCAIGYFILKRGG